MEGQRAMLWMEALVHGVLLLLLLRAHLHHHSHRAASGGAHRRPARRRLALATHARAAVLSHVDHPGALEALARALFLAAGTPTAYVRIANECRGTARETARKQEGVHEQNGDLDRHEPLPLPGDDDSRARGAKLAIASASILRPSGRKARPTSRTSSRARPSICSASLTPALQANDRGREEPTRSGVRAPKLGS